jgi:hypothetical protein
VRHCDVTVFCDYQCFKWLHLRYFMPTGKDAKGRRKKFGAEPAVRGTDSTVGEPFGPVGPDDTGKSTILNSQKPRRA